MIESIRGVRDDFTGSEYVWSGVAEDSKMTGCIQNKPAGRPLHHAEQSPPESFKIILNKKYVLGKIIGLI